MRREQWATKSLDKLRSSLIGYAKTGMFVFALGFFILLMLPVGGYPTEASHRTRCRNNLKGIGIALHNYHDVFGTFPPAYVSDEKGRPMHSWRVLILPYFDQSTLEDDNLFEEYDFTEPWDGPNNVKLLEKCPDVYACPSHEGEDPTMTAYAAIVGEPCVFWGTQPAKIRDITDGTSNTIMVSEVAHARVRWTEPRDISFGAFPGIGHPDGFKSDHEGGVFVLRADGSVKLVSEKSNPEIVPATFTRNGGEENVLPGGIE